MKLTQELLELCYLIEKVRVPAEYTDEGHRNAYRMGYKHGLDGSRKVNTSRFLIKSHADAYNAGYIAGYNAGKSGTSSTDEAVVPKVITEPDGASDSITVIFKGNEIGTVFETRGVWNAIDKKTGKTWEFCKSKSEAIRKLVDFNDLNESEIIEIATMIKEEAEGRRSADQLEIGDEVEITGKVNFQGELGEIVRFGKDKRFVVVRLQSGGDHSFHSSDVSELNNDYADDDDSSTEVSHNKFYVAFYDKDEERSWIGLVTKEHGGQWHEKAFIGKPIYRWGHTHPTFLTPDDILAHLHKDLPRSIEIEGPYYDADEAKQHVAHNWGKLEESLVTEARALTPIQMNKKAVDILIKHGFKKEASENQPGAFATWLDAKDADIDAAAKELGLKDHPYTKELGYTRLLNSAHHELSISGKSAHFRTHKTAADKAGLEEAKKPEAKDPEWQAGEDQIPKRIMDVLKVRHAEVLEIVGGKGDEQITVSMEYEFPEHAPKAAEFKKLLAPEFKRVSRERTDDVVNYTFYYSDKALKEAKENFATKKYPDTKAGVKELIKDQGSAWAKKNIDAAKIFPDPQVDGVWVIDFKNGTRVIVYLAGYKSPTGKIRTHNDIEEGEISEDYIPEAKVDKRAKSAHLASVEIVKKQGLKPVNVAMSIKGGAEVVTNFLASKNISTADAKKIAKALSMTEPTFAKKLGYDPATLFTNKSHEFRIHGDRAILRTVAIVKEGAEEVAEAIEYMKYADWKQAVLLSHPAQAEKIKFRAKMEGEKTIVSAVVPGVDQVYGVWDDVEEIGTVLSEMKSMENLIVDAKTIISKAWADLGKDLAGYSVRDLLLDNMPLPSKKVDEILKALRDEGYID